MMKEGMGEGENGGMGEWGISPIKFTVPDHTTTKQINLH
jgi:hypothetical protein